MKKGSKKFCSLVFLFIILLYQTSFCEIKLPRLISDGMVLQRDIPIKIWGWGAPGEKVTIDFCGYSYSEITSTEGKWVITLPERFAGGPYEMTIKGENEIIIKNILIGDVWVCSGQSNMELQMSRVGILYEDVIANSENDKIRQFLVPMKYDFNNRQEDIESGNWESANPESVLNFTAVGYFFAKNLYEKYHVPIGLINASVGGTPAEAWMSEEALKEFPALTEEFVLFKNQNYIDQIVSGEKKTSDDWYFLLMKKDLGYSSGEKRWYDQNYDDASWLTMKVPSFWDENGLGSVNGAVWFRKEIVIPKSMEGKSGELNLGCIVDSDSTFINGTFVGNVTYKYPPRIYSIPEGLLKEGKNVIAIRVVNTIDRGGFIKDKPYNISVGGNAIDLKGEWKYKLGAVMEPLPPTTFIQYKPVGLFNGMISPLLNYSIKGVIWYQGESNTGRAQEYYKLFPAMIKDWRQNWNLGNFPFLYVQLANFMESKEEPSESGWAELRNAQLETLSVSNTAMAVIIDIGEWNDIHPLNKKTVGDRLALAARKIAYGETDLVSSGPIYESMKVDGNKIILSFNDIGSGLISKSGENLKQFAIAGLDGKFLWANAIIKNNKVIVWNELITNPVAVRYAWADNPEGANLYNNEGLPASPFTTEK